jgi:hypothetical protein
MDVVLTTAASTVLYDKLLTGRLARHGRQQHGGLSFMIKWKCLDLFGICPMVIATPLGVQHHGLQYQLELRLHAHQADRHSKIAA